MAKKALSEIHSVFIDTAPFIYFVEGHPEFGLRLKTFLIIFKRMIS